MSDEELVVPTVQYPEVIEEIKEKVLVTTAESQDKEKVLVEAEVETDEETHPRAD